ncbi:hypothetical protein ACRALDRAFT_209756 [Sodiomyces alcalophilus JCM 7366]|uniref:uncharacterized protein n=1 Tax=Sodiomyces alcalophilus JCM 7366 TaxID=591952 RepID=UPI0039B575F8
MIKMIAKTPKYVPFHAELMYANYGGMNAEWEFHLTILKYKWIYKICFGKCGKTPQLYEGGNPRVGDALNDHGTSYLLTVERYNCFSAAFLDDPAPQIADGRYLSRALQAAPVTPVSSTLRATRGILHPMIKATCWLETEQENLYLGSLPSLDACISDSPAWQIANDATHIGLRRPYDHGTWPYSLWPMTRDSIVGHGMARTVTTLPLTYVTCQDLSSQKHPDSSTRITSILMKQSVLLKVRDKIAARGALPIWGFAICLDHLLEYLFEGHSFPSIFDSRTSPSIARQENKETFSDFQGASRSHATYLTCKYFVVF